MLLTLKVSNNEKPFFKGIMKFTMRPNSVNHLFYLFCFIKNIFPNYFHWVGREGGIGCRGQWILRI